MFTHSESGCGQVVLSLLALSILGAVSLHNVFVIGLLSLSLSCVSEHAVHACIYIELYAINILNNSDLMVVCVLMHAHVYICSLLPQLPFGYSLWIVQEFPLPFLPLSCMRKRKKI